MRLLHIAHAQGYVIPETLLFRAGQVFYQEGQVRVLSQILLRRAYRGSYPCLCGDYAARE